MHNRQHLSNSAWVTSAYSVWAKTGDNIYDYVFK